MPVVYMPFAQRPAVFIMLHLVPRSMQSFVVRMEVDPASLRFMIDWGIRRSLRRWLRRVAASLKPVSRVSVPLGVRVIVQPWREANVQESAS